MKRLKCAIILAAVATASFARAATLHVRDFGNDADRAIAASSAGDTVDFDGITATLAQVILRSHRVYTGSGAKLTAAVGKYVFQTDPRDSGAFVLSGFDFTGPAVRCDAVGGWTHDVEITRCAFHGNCYAYPEHNTIFFSNGARNCNVHGNTCDSNSDGFVIGYGFDGLSITENDIHDGTEGIHYLGHFGHSTLLTVSRNRFRRMHRMPIEIQGDGDHVVCEDNIVDGATVTKTFNENMDTFGISLACDGALKVDCHRNKIVSWERDDGTGMRIGIELGADPKTDGAIDCSDNYVEGTDCAISLSTSLGGGVHDNNVHGQLRGPVLVSFGKNPRLANNGPGVALSWDTNRAWPIDGATTMPVDRPVPRAAPAPATRPAAAAPDSRGSVFLSDIAILGTPTNGWGPIEIDRSNGEDAAGDGKTIVLGGKTYAKGIGCHADALIVFDLAGRYAAFRSDVGIDGEVAGGGGRAMVQIFGDGRPLGAVSFVADGEAPLSIGADVGGVQKLTLAVTAANKNSAHVSFGYPYVTPATQPVTGVPRLTAVDTVFHYSDGTSRVSTTQP